MQISTILALAPFLGAAIAMPSQRQAHEKFHHKKRDITWFTVTSEVVETIYETTTIWVNPGQAPPSASPVSPVAAPSSPSVPVAASPTSTPVAATSSGLVGLQQPSPSSTPVAAPSSPAQAPSPPAQSPSPPAASPSTPAAAPASPSPAPAPASSPAASPSSGSGSSSGGSSGGSYPVSTLEGASDPDGPCTPDQKCQGQMTFYQVGSGACGGNSDPSEYVVAIPSQIMGSQSNGDGTANPLCSRSVMVQLFESQEPIKASVVDKCMGCNTAYSLDMSTGLFDALGGDQNVGRYYNMTWYWA